MIKTNENKTNWTVVVIATIIALGLYLAPSPIFNTNNSDGNDQPCDTITVYYGIPDSSNIPLPPVSGGGTSIVTATTTDSTTDPFFPYYYFQEISEENEEGTFKFEGYTYPYIENDSIKAYQEYFWNWEPKPAEQLVRVDTLIVQKVVEVEKPRPFYEEPAFLIPATASATIGLIYLLKDLFK